MSKKYYNETWKSGKVTHTTTRDGKGHFVQHRTSAKGEMDTVTNSKGYVRTEYPKK